MNIQILSKDDMRKRGRDAFRRGVAREDHGMNWHASALPLWLEGYDEAAQAAQLAHGAKVGTFRVDVAQVA